MSKPKLTSEQKEAQAILKDVEKSKVKSPENESDVLNWDMKQLRAYILKQTSKMNATNKLKWAREFDKRIKEAKKLRDKK